MIDILTLALTHGLIAFAAFRLLSRDDLDDEGSSEKPAVKPWLRNTQGDQNDTDGDRDGGAMI